MSIRYAVMAINIKIDTDFIFKCCFEFTFKIFDKLCYPAIIFIVFLPIADKYIILIAWILSLTFRKLFQDYFPTNNFNNLRKAWFN